MPASHITPVVRSLARYGLYGWGTFDFQLIQSALARLQGAGGDTRALPASPGPTAHVEQLNAPKLLAVFDAEVVRLKAGTSHVAIVIQSGKGNARQTVTVAGLNTCGQLGKIPSRDPQAPPAWGHHSWALPFGTLVHSIAMGRNHSAALVQDSTGSRQVWTAGSNEFGQCLSAIATRMSAWHPVQLPLHDVVQVSAGTDHLVCLHADGTLSTAGLSTNGQSGQGHTHSFTPWLPIRSATEIGRIVTGADHSLAIRPGGFSVWAWGKSEFGQCVQQRPNVTDPVPVSISPVLADHRVVDVACSACASVLALAPRSTPPVQNLPTPPPGRSRIAYSIDGLGFAPRSLWYAGFEAASGILMDLPSNDLAPDGEWGLVSTKNTFVGLHTTRRVFLGRPSGWNMVFRVPDVGERIKRVTIGTKFGLAVTELQ